MLSRLTLTVLLAVAWAAVVYGQAAVEYGLKSAAGTVSSSGTNATIGGCKVDTTLLTCLSRAYPKSTMALIALLTLLIWRWLVRMRAARS